jgi:hypothetical protein
MICRSSADEFQAYGILQFQAQLRDRPKLRPNLIVSGGPKCGPSLLFSVLISAHPNLLV